LRLFAPVRNPGKRHLNVLQRDLSRVQCGHPGVAMAHLLTRYRWADTAGIPPAIAALAKCAHAGFRQTESLGCRMQAIPQYRADAEGVTVFVGKEHGVAGSLVSRKETLQVPHSCFPFRVEQENCAIGLSLAKILFC